MAGHETGRRGRHDAVFAVVLVVAGVALSWVTWATARLGGRENVFVVLLVGLGATVAAILAGIWRKRSWWATALGAAGAVLLTVLLAALTLNGTVAAAKVRPQLDELQAVADRLLSDPSLTTTDHADGSPGCGGAFVDPNVDVPGIGPVRGACVTLYPDVDPSQRPPDAVPLHDRVLFEAGEHALLYQPTGEASLTGACLAHVNGSWWEVQPAAGNCPTGFRFEAGG